MCQRHFKCSEILHTRLHYCRMIFLVRLLYLTVFLSTVEGFPHICPSQPHWNHRAGVICNKTAYYLCMWDTNENTYREQCDEPVKERKGNRIVYSGGTDTEPCSPCKFQPFSYSTIGNYECVYKKTPCSEVGQIIYDNGSYMEDRKCQCDSEAGYVFLYKPTHNCYCDPTKEDCSCIKMSSKVYHITDEFKCTLFSNGNKPVKCNEITSNPPLREPLITVIEDRSEGHTSTMSFRTAFVVVCICTGLLLLIGMVIVSKLFSSSQDGIAEIIQIKRNLEIPDNIKDLQQIEVAKWRKKLSTFVLTMASTAVLDATKKNQCVVIMGPPGCGKTVTAYHVILELMEAEGCDLLIIEDPNDILRYSKANGKQVLFIDDMYGKYRNDSMNKYNTEWWLKQSRDVEILLSKNDNIRILATCRSYIYNLVKENSQVFFKAKDISLSANERKDIGTMYVGNVIDELNDCIIRKFDFFPKLCERFTLDDDKTELCLPCKYIAEELNNIFHNSDVEFIILALMVVSNNSLPKKLFESEGYGYDKKMVAFLTNELNFSSAPTRELLIAHMKALIGTYFFEGNGRYSFISEQLFDIVAFFISKYIMETLLKYGELSILIEKMTFESLDDPNKSNLTITLPGYLEHTYFDRNLLSIKSGEFWDLLQDKKHEIVNYRKKFLKYLKVHTKLLTSKNINVDENNSTILHVVAYHGYADYVEFFVHLLKDIINALNNEGWAPIHCASAKGHVEVVEMLIKAGAKINIGDNGGNTPLHVACEGGHVETVDVLLANKAEILQNHTSLMTPLHTVCGIGNKIIAEMLIQAHTNVNIVDKKQQTSLHWAVTKGFLDITELLLNNNAIVDCHDNKERSPLYYACVKKNMEMVKCLLGYKASTNELDQNKQIPLHLACILGCYEITVLLTSIEATEINQKDIKGNTPLHNACRNGNLNIVILLIEKQADVNATNNSLGAPIHIASRRGFCSVVTFLLSSKADINAEDIHKQTPLLLARKGGHTELVSLLLGHGASDEIDK